MGEQDIYDDSEREAACQSAAQRHGISREKADSCENGEIGCASCPFREPQATPRDRLFQAMMFDPEFRDKVIFGANGDSHQAWLFPVLVPIAVNVDDEGGPSISAEVALNRWLDNVFSSDVTLATSVGR